jgi:hypothetical protein
LSTSRQGVVVAFQLWPLMSMHGVSNRERMQTVNLGHVPHLAFARLVQSDPHEAVSEFPHPPSAAAGVKSPLSR